ncbi:MAG: hypothetical protein IJQ81_16020 [Oscillibacter sp.]|nr:hypothetical protein [Oscillibacter sp.]
MRDFTRKLRQERGASAAFALAIFLIAALFSFTMVEGSLTAAQNAYMQHEEEQAYLSVTSAARLFCREAAVQMPFEIHVPGADDASFNWAYYWQKFSELPPDSAWKIDRDSTPITVELGYVYSAYHEADRTWDVAFPLYYGLLEDINFIQETFLEMVRAIDKGATTPQTKTLTITYPQKANQTLHDKDEYSKISNLFKQVETKVTMNPTDYSVKAEFVNVKNPRDDSDIAQRLKYHVTVTLKCMKFEEVEVVNADFVIRRRTLTWKVDSAGRGGAIAYGET